MILVLSMEHSLTHSLQNIQIQERSIGGHTDTHTQPPNIMCCAKKKKRKNTVKYNTLVGRSVVCIIYITANPNKYKGESQAEGPVNVESMRRQTGKRTAYTNGNSSAALPTTLMNQNVAVVWVRESSMERNYIVNIVCSATCNTFAVAVCPMLGIK